MKNWGGGVWSCLLEFSQAASSSKKGKGKLFPKFRPFGGVLARALLGDDEKFGGERGAIDFIRTKKKKTTQTPTSEKRKSHCNEFIKLVSLE